MKNTNLFKNGMTLAATTTVTGVMGYSLWKENQRQYEALKKANPNDDVVWEYRDKPKEGWAYGGFGGGGLEWTVKKKPESTSPSKSPTMKP